MALLILKILGTIVLSLAGLLWLWTSFIGVMMAHETTPVKPSEWLIVIVPPAIAALIIFAMW